MGTKKKKKKKDRMYDEHDFCSREDLRNFGENFAAYADIVEFAMIPDEDHEEEFDKVVLPAVRELRKDLERGDLGLVNDPEDWERLY